MSRINTNVTSQIAQRVLRQNQAGLSVSLQRLSTGIRINSGKDDPAGLIASENLGSEIKATTAAITNADRADQVVNIAEGGLQEVSGMLTELQGLLTGTASKAGLSKEEKQANQLQVDSILQTIDRVSSSTNFQGLKLLNGSFDFQVSGVAAGVTDYRVNAAKYGSSALDVNVLVTASAQQGGLFLSAGGSALDLGTGSSFVIEIGGSLGSRQLTFSSGTSLTNIAAAMNTFKDVTGIEAAVSGTGLKLYSTNFGSSEFVSVKVVHDGSIGSSNNVGIYNLQAADFSAANTSVASTFAAANNPVTDIGQNIAATINGITATTDGKTARINSDFLDVEVTLNTSTAQTLGAVGTSKAFSITGGGADFQLASKVDVAGRVSLGIQDVAVRKLGTSSLGFLDSLSNGRVNNVVNGDITDAQKIVNEAVKQVSGLRGRLGAFQKNVIGATIRSLGVNVENTSAAQSVIRDADFAAETAGLTRSQILTSASTNILALANTSPQSVLQLLG
jgi:flagellin